MWLARHFPGLHLRPADVGELTPEETNSMRRVGERLLDAEFRERLEHTRALAKASGARIL